MMMSLCFAMVCYFQQPSNVYIDRVAIKVNDKILTQRELLLIYNQLRSAFLQNFSGTELDAKLKEAWSNAVTEGEEQLLFYEKAVELGIAFSEDEIRDSLNSLKETNGLSDEALEAEVRKQMGMSVEEYVGYSIRDRSRQAVIQREVISQIQIDDSEIAKYYDENKDQFMNPVTYRISEIVVFKDQGGSAAKQSQILAAQQALTSGKAFSDVAKEFSETPTKENGGDLGVSQFGDLNESLEKAVREMKPGDVSRIIETDFAYFLIKLDEYNDATAKPIDDVSEQIINALRMPRLTTTLEKYVEDLKAEFLLETILKNPPSYLNL